MSTAALPILASRFDQVLEQLTLLTKDIEQHKMDAGVVVMLRNGQADIRGLGEVRSTEQAAAVLFMSFKSLPPASQEAMLKSLERLMRRSVEIEAEAKLWRSTPDLHQPS